MCQLWQALICRKNMPDDIVKKFAEQLAPQYVNAATTLANLIKKHDPHVEQSIGKMMRNDAVLYCQQDIMKYAITCHANHVSLHLMPIYCYADLYTKYKKLMTAGKFQKGCINFKDYDNLPVDDIALLIAECAAMPYPTEYQLRKK